MIQITKNPEPQVLIDNKATWTSNLLNLVAEYGSYAKIPDAKKKVALALYSHKDVIDALNSHDGSAKCVYCESYVRVTSYLNVEHFHPKSIYPNETFDWQNLFVGCTCCNGKKLNLDTVKEPFINPLSEDPEDYLTFNGVTIVPKASDPNSIEYKKAWNVINNCYLYRIDLNRSLSNIAISFSIVEGALIDKINLYDSIKQKARRLQIAGDILISINDLNFQASEHEQYAGYMRYLLRGSIYVKKAINIINNHSADLGFHAPFIWCFKY